MKTTIRKKGLLLFALLISMHQLTSQISIGKTDMPSPDDTVRISTGLNPDFINYQETGEDYVWDFSQLVPISQSVDTFVSMTDVHVFYQISFFGSSNLVGKENNYIPIPNFPITEPLSFYNNTNSYFGVAGEGYLLYGIPIPLKFDSPDILYQFPMEFGNTGSSFAEYAFGLDNFGYTRKEISRSNTVDGWGTLITPYGTFDVLRLKSEVVEFDSLYIDSLGIGLPLSREYTEYSWLGKGQKIPLLQITSSLIGAVATYIDSLRFPSAINDHINFKSGDVEIFPNPATDLINITFELLSTSDVEISIYNSNGIRVANDNLLNHGLGTVNVKLNMRQFGLKDGMYLLKVVSGKQVVVGKVVLH